MNRPDTLCIATLLAHYRADDFTPRELIETLLDEAPEHDPTWIMRLSREQLEPYLDALEQRSPDELPLYGIPFAIKDNIDLAGVPTTAACPAFAYTPEHSAFVVQKMIDAGAIPLGKTNLDQFATGLVGVRSPEPYGVPANAFDARYIPGGSSAGSAVATAKSQVSFAFGTDTAGSGRVPACFNNLLGLKPTKGLLSTAGVVPACASLDCVSIFALTSDDAHAVLQIAAGYDPDNVFSRAHSFAAADQRYGEPPAHFRFGVPPRAQWQLEPDYAQAFEQALDQLKALGGEAVEVDCQALLDAAKLLYEGPWVAERYHAVRALIERDPDALLPVTRTIIAKGADYSAVDTFDAFYRLAAVKQRADRVLADVDVMVVPTTVMHPTLDEVASDPIGVNSRLGTWTNFVNLLDQSALAVPTGFLDSGLPFGVTLLGAAFDDLKLLSYARRLEAQLDLPIAASGAKRSIAQTLPAVSDGTLEIAVCGAHLEGLPLNGQLTERGGELVTRTRTAPRYRFYALAGGPPSRPGLVRDEANGTAIEVEVWRLPMAHVGSFLAGIPAPLGLGKLELEDSRWVTGFICEGSGLQGARDITAYGGWRAWMKAMS